MADGKNANGGSPFNNVKHDPIDVRSFAVQQLPEFPRIAGFRNARAAPRELLKGRKSGHKSVKPLCRSFGPVGLLFIVERIEFVERLPG